MENGFHWNLVLLQGFYIDVCECENVTEDCVVIGHVLAATQHSSLVCAFEWIIQKRSH
jgi:hypothetical protein